MAELNSTAAGSAVEDGRRRIKRHPAYAREVMRRRADGDRIGLLVVSVRDWRAGLWFAHRPEVARVVVVPTQQADALRFDCAHALDVVICGSDTDFYLVADAVLAYDPASLWGEFSDGFYRLERGRRGWASVAGPFSLMELPRAVRDYRLLALAIKDGGYGKQEFDKARTTFMQAVLGDASASEESA